VIQNSSADTRTSFGDSERNGLIERVIENWLTSVNERQYQLPFCQVLAARSETILYVSSHGPFEKGKDVITSTADGTIHAYQLKKGDIGLREWREIHGEVENLVELAIEISGRIPTTDFVPYLVTNGNFTDPVLEQIRVANLSRHSRGFHHELRTIAKGELFGMFREAHGAYLPRELVDFRAFLELILHDGSAPAAKETAALLFEHVLPRDWDAVGHLDIARAATSVALLTAYITGPAILSGNHWSVFEYWVLAGCYVLYLAEKTGRAESACISVFEICEMGAENALLALAEECKDRDNFVQGLPLDDGAVYRARMTILLGLLCALDLSLQVRGKAREYSSLTQRLMMDRLKETIFWGESATPFYWMCMLVAEQHCNSMMAEGLALRLVKDICDANGDSAEGRGCPNPYYSAEEALRIAYGYDRLNDEQFVGFSYSVLALVHFLARRLRRRALASLWYGVTRLGLADYIPANAAEWFRWESKDGVLNSHLVEEPQSWEVLRTRAKNVATDSLPQALLTRPAFLIWYVLVYPHRFTPATTKVIDDAVRNSSR
jgi:hypothetical protein